MRTLLLLRHGKSSWDNPAIPDHDRPLKKRGIKAARRMGQLLKELGLKPELVLCSTATRAKETVRLVFESAKVESQVQFVETLYHCAPSQFVHELHRSGDGHECIMIVGHNPGLEDFCSSVIGEVHSVPTCALVEIEFPIASWSELTDTTCGRLAHVWRPRELERD